MEMLADADMLVQVRVNGTLTGASYATPANTTATETACEVDTTASAITGGELIWQGIIPASVGQARNLSTADLLDLDIPANQPVTLCARRLTSTGGTISAAVLRWREEW
jgi:hypothetical protein